MRTVLFLAGLAASLLLIPRPAPAQSRFQYVGPNECLNCHDHQDERQWYEKQEILEVQKRFPQKSANAGHINALKQLEGAKSDGFAKAIGLGDKYAVTGACVKCHATVYQGDANAGVSCESCHGPASGYLKPHQTKGAYAQSLPLGLVDIVGKVATWAQQCTGCHVMDDQRLVTAGHPSGDDFDLGAMYGPVSLHFAKKYGENDVRGISRDIVRNIIATRRGGGAATVARGLAPAPPPAASAPPAPAPVPPVAAVPAPSSTTPPAAVSLPPAGVVAPPPSGRSSVPAASPSIPAASASSAVAAPVAPMPAPATAVTPMTTPAAESSEALPTSLSAAVAVVQGRLIATLTGLVAGGATVPLRSSTPPPALATYTGPDAALLQLQREAIALALEVLGTPPPAPNSPPK